MTNGSSPAGWYRDPTGQGDARYWNGTVWTQSVDRAGTTLNIAIDPSAAQQPPVPGTQVQAPQPAPQMVVQQSSSGSPLATIIGVVVVVLLVIVVLAFIGNSDSSDDTPAPGTNAPPAEAPAEPAPEAPADTGG